MSARIFTQISDDQPKVLVVGPSSWVQKEIIAQFKRYDFAVVVTEYTELTTALILSQDWYKVVIVVGFEADFIHSYQQSVESLSLIKSRLSIFRSVSTVKPNMAHSVMCVSPNWTLYTDTHLHQKKTLVVLRELQIEIAASFHEIYQVVIENLVSVKQLKAQGLVGCPPLDFMLQSRRNTKILFPKEKIRLLSMNKCTQQLGLLLRKPLRKTQKTVILTGSEFAVSDVAQEISRRVYVQFGIKTDVLPAVFTESRTCAGIYEQSVYKTYFFENQDEYKSEGTHVLKESIPELVSPIFDGIIHSKEAWFNTKKHDFPVLEIEENQKKTPKNQFKINATPTVPTLMTQPKPVATPVIPVSTTQSAQPKEVSLSNTTKQVEHTKTNITKTTHLSAVNGGGRTLNNQTKPGTLGTKKSDDISIDAKLSSLFSSERKEKKTNHLTDLYQETTKAKSKNKKRTTAFYVGSVVSFFAASTLFLAIIFATSTYFLKTGLIAFLTQISTQESSVTIPKKQDFPSHLQLTKSFVDLQLAAYSAVLPPAFFYNSTRASEVFDAVTNSAENIEKVQHLQRNKVLGWLGKEGGVTQEIGSHTTVPAINTQNVYEQLSRLSAQLQELFKKNISSQESKEAGQNFLRRLADTRSAIISYQQLEPLFPTLFGEEGRRSYAVLFQNEQELRATGGFIQAVALITFDNGMLIDYQVFSSYQLDNQLAAIVDSPQEIKNLLGEERLFLRDSNWEPDFPTSAAQISWFLERILNKSVDGVIALNIHSFKTLLSQIGPLELPQHNEVITDRNLGERMEFHSEVTLVESTESNDYAVVLLRALLHRISDLSVDKIPAFLGALHAAVTERELFIYLADSSELSVVNGLGWSGALVSPACPTQLSVSPCLVDSLTIIDSNIGVNKANYHIRRQDRHTILLGNSAAIHNRSITLQNTAQSNAWPRGPYHSYLRFYLPITSQAQSFKVNGQKIEPEELLISQSDEHVIVGLQTTTPIKSETIINLEYSIPFLEEQRSNDSFSYVFFSQKQAGAGNPLSAVTITYPPSVIPTLIAPQAAVDLDSITYTNINSGHVFVGATFQRK